MLQIAILQINMAIANFTGDGEQKTFEQLLCSAGLTDKLSGQLAFISVLNSFLSVTAFLGNALILMALHKESSLHPPSKLLLRNLATTDLSVGLIAEPLYVTSRISALNKHWSMCHYISMAGFITGNILCGVSLLTLDAISVDRLLALLLGLRYRQVVTLNRVHVIVIAFWFVSTVYSAMYIWNPLITFWYGTIGLPLSLITSIFSYTKIFCILRNHQNQIQEHVQQPSQTNQLNIARYKKAVSTAIWLQLTLVACYLPLGIVTALATSGGRSLPLYNAWCYAVTLAYLNSSLNPILYCWKLEEVRQAVKNIIRQVLCNCFST